MGQTAVDDGLHDAGIPGIFALFRTSTNEIIELVSAAKWLPVVKMASLAQFDLEHENQDFLLYFFL